MRYCLHCEGLCRTLLPLHPHPSVFPLLSHLLLPFPFLSSSLQVWSALSRDGCTKDERGMCSDLANNLVLRDDNVKPCQYVYLATQMTKGMVKITNIFIAVSTVATYFDNSVVTTVDCIGIISLCKRTKNRFRTMRYNIGHCCNIQALLHPLPHPTHAHKLYLHL